jgi:predicted restriction endonuclease
MSITVPTRKTLWARLGNRCSICKTEFVTPDLKDLPRVIIGEECHIVSFKENGPRWAKDLEEDFDAYENLILLCATHHTMIDRGPKFFTTEKVLGIKSEHEGWVKVILEKDATAF